MAKKKGNRIIVALLCGECKAQNYLTERNKINTEKKLLLKKYCRWCRKKTEHKESSRLK